MLKKMQKTMMYLLIAYAVAGFIILPLVLKSQIIQNVQKHTNAKISIESVSFNPFIFQLKITGIELNALDDKPLLGIKSLLLNVEVYSLFNSAVHIKNFIIEKPEISLIYNRDKSLNINSLLKSSHDTLKEDENTSSSKFPRIILDRVALREGSIYYEDYTNKNKFDFSFDSIGFELKNIDTHDFNTSDAEVKFYSTLGDGGFVKLESKIVGFKPFIVDGSLTFEASKLYTQWKYLQDSLHLEVADGQLSFYTDYHLNLDDLSSASIHNLSASLVNLRIKPKKEYKDILNLDSFLIQDATIKPLQKDIRVKNIALESLYLKVKRDIKGEIDWLEYIKSNADNSASTNKEQNTSKVQKSEPWSVLLENISLQKIKVDFYDKGVRPQVDTKLNEMNIHVKNITLAGIEPFLYEMNMKMNENFKCTSKGSIKHQVLDAQTYSKCSGFDFVHYRPYIDAMAKKSFQTHDVKLESAQSSFDANVSVWDIDSQWIVNVNDANFNLTQFALSKKSTKEELVKFSSFDMSGVRLNTKSREVVIQKTSLENLDIQTSRLKEGTLNIENLIVPHPQSVSSHSLAESKKEKEFKILLKHFALKSSRISFNDKLFSPSILTQIDTINVNAYEIDSQINSRFKYDARLRINNSGTVKSSGAIQHTPFEQNGVFELQKLSLKEFTPYVQENAYLKIDDGFLSLKTKTKYSKNVEDADLKVDGSLHLEGLFINDSRDESSLLSLSDLKLNAFTYEMFPNRLFINSIDLNSFYVNAIIDEKKNMNFASLMKKKAEENSTQVPHAKENETKQEFPIKIMKLNVDMGSAHFADLSLPIQFKTHIHDLKGSVYSLSNIAGETSYVDVAGEIDRYGSTQLKGSINAGDPKSYTDLDFNFKNLELNSLSGYSANFAGYKIDKGKLYIDLGYKILDSELVGKNSIVIKNIELGEEMKDENITSLPLGLAVALLEDRDGIIDINMPVEGNIDEPDFKYGALLLKTLGNLIVKAVSAPFKALGSMLGMDAEGLEYIEFESGLVHILPPEKEKLDNISMMMIKRPKISLSIRGKYDEITDKEALQKEKLIALVIKKSGRKNKENHETAMTRELLENIYGDFGADGKVLNAMKIELKKRYKDKAFEREYLNSLIRECIKVQPLAKEELLSLAQKRAEELSSYLVGEKGVEISRIEILDADSADGKSDRFVKTKLDIIVK